MIGMIDNYMIIIESMLIILVTKLIIITYLVNGWQASIPRVGI